MKTHNVSLKWRTSSLSFIATFAVGISSFSAHSTSLSDITNSMYTSSTSPSSYTSSDGSLVMHGGAASVRFRPRNINVVNFQPPSISAGCSGLDFFGGSLTLMSKDELIQAGRNIAAGAAVYAFRLSLNSICSSCMSIMSQIQAYMDRINAMAKTSCEDTIALLESAKVGGGTEGKATSWEENKYAKGILSAINPDNIPGVETGSSDSWLKMVAKHVATSDAEKTIVESDKDMTFWWGLDPHFNMAYNTELWSTLFPYLSEEYGRAAVWSLLAGTDKCENEVDTTKEYKECGVRKIELTHSYKEIIEGNTSSTSGDTSIKLPKCNDIETRTLANNRQVKRCKYAGNGSTIGTLSIEPFKKQFVNDIFGAGAYVDSTTKLDDTKVCTGNRVTAGVNSPFAKYADISTVRSFSLIPQQISAMGFLGSDKLLNLRKAVSTNDHNGQIRLRTNTNAWSAMQCPGKRDYVFSHIEAKVDAIYEGIHELAKTEGMKQIGNLDLKPNIKAKAEEMLGSILEQLATVDPNHKSQRPSGE